MSDGEDENIIMGDDDYKEEEEAITTMTDVSSIASLDDIPATPPVPPPPPPASNIGFHDYCGHSDDHGQEMTISHLTWVCL